MLCSSLAFFQRAAQAAERYENRYTNRYAGRGERFDARREDRDDDRRFLFERDAHRVRPAGYYDQFGCWHAYSQRW